MRKPTQFNMGVAVAFNEVDKGKEMILSQLRKAQAEGQLISDGQISFTEKLFDMILDAIDANCFDDS